MKNIEKLQEHPLLIEMSKILNKNFHLVGGAVIDLLEGRKPKDFDFIDVRELDFEKLVENGFTFKSSSKTAFTFTKDTFAVQFLKTTVDTFDFTISQSLYNCKTQHLKIDRISFDSKILIPTDYTLSHTGKTINALKRIPHYAKKGYRLPEVTYQSLLNNISAKGVCES